MEGSPLGSSLATLFSTRTLKAERRSTPLLPVRTSQKKFRPDRLRELALQA